MTDKAPPKSAAERKRAQRRRQRERGEPSVPAFDAALREAVFASYHGGELSIDLPDLVQAVVERLAGVAGVSERGCRTTTKVLLERVTETIRDSNYSTRSNSRTLRSSNTSELVGPRTLRESNYPEAGDRVLNSIARPYHRRDGVARALKSRPPLPLTTNRSLNVTGGTMKAS